MTDNMEDGETTSVLILDLPTHSSLRFNGQTIHLQRDDFVGISGIPTADSFNFLAVRPCVQTHHATKEPVFATVTVGFVLPPHGTKDAPYLIRKYDPSTEEVSNQPLDEVTLSRLVEQVQCKRMDLQRLVPYPTVVRSSGAVEHWRNATCFVSEKLLFRRGIPPGTKIVPGCYDPEDDDDAMTHFVNQSLPEDGRSPQYPAIPVLEANTRRTTHRGTKTFLHKLSPAQRTALLMETNPCTTALELVLREEYNGKWDDWLGDIQLSYTLFLNLHCYASLQHWRDLVALSCRASLEDVGMLRNLAQVLTAQLHSMEGEFLEDADMSEGNFLVPSLQLLLRTLSANTGVAQVASSLGSLLRQRFPQHDFASSMHNDNSTRVEEVEMVDAAASAFGSPGEEKDSEEGPVMVPLVEIEAAAARDLSVSMANKITYDKVEVCIRERYPILVAAIQPHEDILMTCARLWTKRMMSLWSGKRGTISSKLKRSGLRRIGEAKKGADIFRLHLKESGTISSRSQDRQYR
jgi:hypothetical protein